MPGGARETSARAQGVDERARQSRCLAVRVMPTECCRVALGLGCEEGRQAGWLEAGAMRQSRAVGGGPAVKRSYGLELRCDAKDSSRNSKRKNCWLPANKDRH
jgi:hypothetical protein